jgi:protein SCO1/2
MNRSLLAFAALLCLFTGWWVGALVQNSASIDADPSNARLPRALADFALIDADSRRFGLEDLRGRWTLVYLGYTSCPDVCPITLQELARLAAGMASIETDHPMQYLFVSVDPARDTPARLREYLAYFDPSFIGASANDEGLSRFAQQLDMVFVPVADNAEGDYVVKHSASLALINPHAEMHALFESPHFAGKLQAELIRLLKGFNDKNTEP